MDFKNIDEKVIQKYQEDEQLMIRLFVQWCANHELDPHELYKRAYPDQQENTVMKNIIELADARMKLTSITKRCLMFYNFSAMKILPLLWLTKSNVFPNDITN